jgi:hypothetical protein
MKELSFYEFTQLSKEEQYDLVFREGEFINSSFKNDVKFALYQLHSFYVEVTYNAKDNRIVNLTSYMSARN